MPASLVSPWTCKAMPPRAVAMMFCKVLLPVPVPPVIQPEGRHFNPPHTGAMAIQPATSVPDTGRSQDRRRHKPSTLRDSSTASLGASGKVRDRPSS